MDFLWPKINKYIKQKIYLVGRQKHRRLCLVHVLPIRWLCNLFAHSHVPPSTTFIIICKNFIFLLNYFNTEYLNIVLNHRTLTLLYWAIKRPFSGNFLIYIIHKLILYSTILYNFLLNHFKRHRELYTLNLFCVCVLA